ncbi:MAG TPA: ABC transporter substrate-binding protein [Coriobacteriia bacterium]
MNRTVRTAIAALVCVALAAGLAACSQPAATPTTPAASAPVKIRIGVLPTEDSLPLWVAERDGLFAKAGLDVTMTVFPSAVERDAAMTAGAIDGMMGDLVATALLRDGGVPVKAVMVMLGATAKEGRFGIAVKPGSKATSLKDLAGVPVGTSSATIQELVLYSLMNSAGVATTDVKKEEVKKVPLRFELLMSGKLEAAALPEPFLSLAEKSGAKVLADDTTGNNISQTVLIFSEKYLNAAGSADAIAKLFGVWDTAVATINADPGSFRPLLVTQARLPAQLADSYAVNTYPKAAAPTQDMASVVLYWVDTWGLQKTEFTYEDMIWTLPAK